MSSSIFFFFSFFLGLVLVAKSVSEGLVLVLDWEFGEKFLMEVSFPLTLDTISCLFCLTVFYISGCVMLFSGFYMAHEVFIGRFISLVSLFVFSMVMLILFPNYLALMVGWDWLGLVSFLLVVYYMNGESLSAGMITAISNRVGDVFFILVIAFMACYVSFSMFSQFEWSLMVIGVLVLLGSMTKSAQIPFSAWLPEAMAAPTPVSTLVHSSTLVTAGVYVLVRFSGMLDEMGYYFLLIVSMMTVIMAGSGGVMEVDMKKVVALSTLSQVGMMMFSISIGAVNVAFFHLIIHAFFKALMFICVGGVIYYSGGFQDARFLSGLWIKMPLVCGLLFLSNLSLMGFPYMSGFYSKEMILGVYLLGNSSVVGLVFLFVSLVLTCVYSIRMMLLMMSHNEVSSMQHYSSLNFYYVSSLVLMGNGAVGMGMLMQLLVKDFLFFVPMFPGCFYGWFLMSLVWFLNVLVLIGLMGSSWEKGLLKFFISSMWFLKTLSGNLVSTSFLVNFSKLVSFVEMGWIRGFVWSGGLKSGVFKLSNVIHKTSFGLVGCIVMFSLLMWVVVVLL